MIGKKQLIECAEKCIEYARKHRLKRVNDSYKIWETKDGHDAWSERNTKGVCRTCAVGLPLLLKTHRKIGKVTAEKLIWNIEQLLNNRGDNACYLLTVRNMRDMYKVLREAARM